MSFSNTEEQLIIKGDKDVIVKPADLESEQEYTLQQLRNLMVQHPLPERKDWEELCAKVHQNLDAQTKCMLDLRIKQMVDPRDIKVGREVMQELEQADLESEQEYALQQEKLRNVMVQHPLPERKDWEELCAKVQQHADAQTKRMLDLKIKQMVDPRDIKVGREVMQELEQVGSYAMVHHRIEEILQVKFKDLDARINHVLDARHMVDLSYIDRFLEAGGEFMQELEQADPEMFELFNEFRVLNEEAAVDIGCFYDELLSGQVHVLQQEMLPKTTTTNESLTN